MLHGREPQHQVRRVDKQHRRALVNEGVGRLQEKFRGEMVSPGVEISISARRGRLTFAATLEIGSGASQVQRQMRHAGLRGLHVRRDGHGDERRAPARRRGRRGRGATYVAAVPLHICGRRAVAAAAPKTLIHRAAQAARRGTSLWTGLTTGTSARAPRKAPPRRRRPRRSTTRSASERAEPSFARHPPQAPHHTTVARSLDTPDDSEGKTARES